MAQTRARRYVPGDHKVLCDLCGLTYMRSETKLQWNNLLACSECFDPKHPQLNIRGKADRQTVDIARPESENDNDLFFYTPPSQDPLLAAVDRWFDTMNYTVPRKFS